MTCCPKMESYQSFVHGEGDCAIVSEGGECGGSAYLEIDGIFFSTGFKSTEVEFSYCPFCGTKQERS